MIGKIIYHYHRRSRKLSHRVGDEKFRDLNCVEGSAFEKLITANKKIKAVIKKRIFAETTHKNIILTRSKGRHGIGIGLRVADNLNAGGLSKIFLNGSEI